MENYYYGIRRYPYSTSMGKNPPTFKDIDPAQADNCASGAPFSPLWATYWGSCASDQVDEVHNVGEVWCEMLWEARANLIGRHGASVGNDFILRFVTDGMKLCPPNPTFTQARDAILQAGLVDYCGLDSDILWAAFAKRGLGWSAVAPNSSTTSGVTERFDIPPMLYSCED